MSKRAKRFAVLRRKLDRTAWSEVINAGVIVGRLLWNDPDGELEDAIRAYRQVRGDT